MRQYKTSIVLTAVLILCMVFNSYAVTLYSTNGYDYIPITDTTNFMTGSHTMQGNDILTTGTTVTMSGSISGIPASKDHVGSQSGFDIRPSNSQISDFVFSSGNVRIDADISKITGQQTGVYKTSAGDMGVLKINLPTTSISGGSYNITGNVTRVQIESSPNIDIALTGFGASGSHTVTDTNGITPNGTVMGDVSGEVLGNTATNQLLDWGTARLSASTGYTSLSSNFAIQMQQMGSVGSQLGFVGTTNADGSVSGKAYGTFIDNENKIKVLSADINGIYSPTTSTLKMAAAGVSMDVNRYINMLSTAPTTLQNLGIPITERYVATVGNGAFYDGTGSSIGTFTAVGLNELKLRGDDAAKGIFTLISNGDYSLNANKTTTDAYRLSVTATALDTTTYSIDIKGAGQGSGVNGYTSLMQPGSVVKGQVTGTGTNGVVFNGIVSGNCTGSQSGAISVTGAGSWRK
jgi:hypothetical protein